MISINYRHYWLSFLFSILLLFCEAGLQDTVAQTPGDTTRFFSFLSEKSHSPAKAAFYAALLPTAGQIYNRKYWKIPIVLTGYGATAFLIHYNNNNYHQSKRDYLAETDTLPETVNQSGKAAATLRADIDNFRRNRDLSFLMLLAWHGLCIIDANVDAHLMTWDVDEDLSLSIRPEMVTHFRHPAGLGVRVALRWH